MIEVVVSDATPLQYLHQSGTLHVLPKLFDRVVISQAVIAELAAGMARGHDLLRPRDCSWVEIAASKHALTLPAKLGRGEQEALSMAVERHLPVLLDDYDARACAVSLGLSILGTFGILIRAKRQRLIPEVVPAVNAIYQLGFRTSERMLQVCES